MSNSNQIKITVNLNRNCGQKKLKTNQKALRGMTDSLIEKIVSELPLIQILGLRSVSQQFKTCIEQCLAKEESIQFVNTYGKDLDVWVNKCRKNQINVNKMGHNFNDDNYCLIQLLSKFRQIKCLQFDNNIRINNQMLEWLFTRFPKLSSLSLLDYRCNYFTFDWMAIGDSLRDTLVSLQIECRLNQHISGDILAQLVAKLYRLEDLTIVCPRRRLEKVFTAFGPNLLRLRITYCISLDVDEIKALISGNGRQLQVLDIHYQSISGIKINQNQEFDLICSNLLNLRYLSFNHLSLSDQSLSLISNLKKLKTFRHNLSGLRQLSPKGMRTVVYENKLFDWRHFESIPSLESLSLSYIELCPIVMFNWKNTFANLKKLSLKTMFVCACPARYSEHCINCLRLCYHYLSELKSLQSLDLSDSLCLVLNYHYFIQLEQIQSFSLNVHRLKDISSFDVILKVLLKMATQRQNRPLAVRLYNIRFSSESLLIKFIEIPNNLKITLNY